ncbi:MAG: hypothetical protein ACHQVS_03995 [Candidatus Babeliales bacterium]
MMTKSIVVCLACLCCHTHCTFGCEVEKHACPKESSSALKKALDQKMEEYVQELLKIQKSPELQSTAESYSRHLACLQERLDEATHTKLAKIAACAGNIVFYQQRLVNCMNAQLMDLFDEQRDTKVSAVPLERVAEINAQLLASFKEDTREATI